MNHPHWGMLLAGLKVEADTGVAPHTQGSCRFSGTRLLHVTLHSECLLGAGTGPCVGDALLTLSSRDIDNTFHGGCILRALHAVVRMPGGSHEASASVSP